MKKEKTSVTPWEVKGVLTEKEYQRLAKEFGIQILNKQVLDKIKKHTKQLHFMLTRQVFFAHRDLNWLLSEHEKGNKVCLGKGR